MKQLKQLFHVPEKGKLPEKVMMARVGLSVGLILLCLVAMSVSAYAFFSTSVSSNMSQLQAAVYQLNVTPSEGAESISDNTYRLDNSSNTEETSYTFTISTTDATTATVGYAEIIVQTDFEEAILEGSMQELQYTETKYYTAPIWSESDPQDASKATSRTVTVTVGAGKMAKVQFVAQWGSYSGNDVLGDDAILVSVTESSQNEEPPSGGPTSGTNEGASYSDGTEGEPGSMDGTLTQGAASSEGKTPNTEEKTESAGTDQAEDPGDTDHATESKDDTTNTGSESEGDSPDAETEPEGDTGSESEDQTDGQTSEQE